MINDFKINKSKKKLKRNPGFHLQVTPFGTTYLINVKTIMASATNSQNLPRTFFKLSATWDKKTGKRTSGQGVWVTGSPEISSKFPVQYIPYILSSFFENKTRPENMAGALNSLQPAGTKIAGNQIWIYAMRTSDCLPKNVTEEKKLYTFVKTMLRGWCERDTYLYMEKNIHICVCFFVWYFTKPNFFYTDKVIRQTTRNGIQRVWTPLLLEKEPKSVAVSAKPAKVASISTTCDALLSKQQQQQQKLRNDIQVLVDLGTEKALDWTNAHGLHKDVSECMNSSETALSIKQNKKLQKLYNEYTTITGKINKTMEKKNKVQRANAKIVAVVDPVEWAHELGAPPVSRPQLVRHSACEEEEDEVPREPVECWGCSSNQPNQQAHMGGCLPDALEDEDDVPDTWEDL